MKLILTSIMIFSMMLAESKISGVSYFGYSIYNIDTEAENDKFRGFELDRVYFTYKKKISDNTSFKFQADMQNKGQAYYMFIKNAKFDIKFAGNSKLTIGMQGMNMFNIAEKT